MSASPTSPHRTTFDHLHSGKEVAHHESHRERKIILPGEIVEGRALLFDEKIVGIVSTDEIGSAEVIDAKGGFVSPGLIDIHIHGYLGEDVSDGSEEGLLTMAEGIVKNGVTAWLPTR